MNLIFKDELKMEDRKPFIKKLCGIVASVAFLTVISKANVLSSPFENDLSEGGSFDIQNESKFDQKPASCPNADASSTDRSSQRTSKKRKKLQTECKQKRIVSESSGFLRSRYLMLVSTLDGKISALNMDKEGAIEWSINTGSNPLLSSSISNLELSRDGRHTRLIPSLDGGLYQYDGVSVEPVPFNAETLLSSSFRLNDRSIMVGGKESETYGVDLQSGRVKYVCDMEGCKQFEHGSDDEDSLLKTSQTLVISRTTRTVRAIEMVSGSEKWNFSVGEHEIAYISAASRDLHDAAEITDQSSTSGETCDEADDVRIENCDETSYDQEESMFDFPWWNAEEHIDMADLHFKVIVPKGLILAVLKSQPSRIIWKHQFSHAIAKAWTLQSGELTEMDLFDASHVPALGFDAHGDDQQEPPQAPPPTPALYIGTHERQVYVQASVRMQQAVEESVSQAVATHSPITMPVVTWKPYIASSPSRTPAEQRNPLQITWENGMLRDENDETALSLWCEYPHDVGYYLYPETTTTPLPFDNGSTVEADTSDFYFEEDITVTLWNWWKEVLAISLLSSFILNIIVVKLFFPKPHDLLPGDNSPSHSPTHSRTNSECVDGVGSDEKPASEGDKKSSGDIDPMDGEGKEKGKDEEKKEEKLIPFASRYESDFETVERIGQGGFGVVSHVKNRIDDVDYAIKRITLNDSKRSKDRVIREVKALAKLNHPHIVRYHQAWIEYPPAGWQERRDLQLFPPKEGEEEGIETHEITTPLNSYSIRDLKSTATNSNLLVPSANKKPPDRQVKKVDFNPLKPFNDDEHDFPAAHENNLPLEQSYPDNTNSSRSSTFGGEKGGNFFQRGAGDEDTNSISFGLSDTRKHGSTEKFIPHSCDSSTQSADDSSDNNEDGEESRFSENDNDFSHVDWSASSDNGFSLHEGRNKPHVKLSNNKCHMSHGESHDMPHDSPCDSTNKQNHVASNTWWSDDSSIDIIFDSSERSSTSGTRNTENGLPFQQYASGDVSNQEESLDIVFEEEGSSINSDSGSGSETPSPYSEQTRPSRCSKAIRKTVAHRSANSVHNTASHSCINSLDISGTDTHNCSANNKACIDANTNSSDVNSNNNKDGSHANSDSKLASGDGDNKHEQKSRPKSLELKKIEESREKHESGSKRIYLFIQMQLCKKHSLKDWLASPSLREDGMALDIFWQIVSAVDYVHHSGLMHRDLKPSNILFALDGTVKVGDFGLVTHVEHDDATDTLTPACGARGRRRRGEHTDQVGTKLYMSPEQIEGKSYSHKVDIYALGLILFELFHATFDTQMERVRTLLQVRRREFPKKFVDERPQHHDLARSLLSPRADERPSTAEILEHALLHAHEHESHARARSASRTRTVSQCSSHSAHSNLSSSAPKDGGSV